MVQKRHQANVVLIRGQKAGDYLPRHVGKFVVQGLPNLVGLVFFADPRAPQLNLVGQLFNLVGPWF